MYMGEYLFIIIKYQILNQKMKSFLLALFATVANCQDAITNGDMATTNGDAKMPESAEKSEEESLFNPELQEQLDWAHDVYKAVCMDLMSADAKMDGSSMDGSMMDGSMMEGSSMDDKKADEATTMSDPTTTMSEADKKATDDAMCKALEDVID